jgi:cyanate permease
MEKEVKQKIREHRELIQALLILYGGVWWRMVGTVLKLLLNYKGI